jgi:pyruvate/2-oxoglutarate dehydrogenase complex dihydrolipoamide acyltransferase (E2) component
VDGVVAQVLVEVGQSVDAHALVVEFADEGDEA